MNSLKKYLYNPFAIAIGFCVLLISIFAVLWILVPPPPKAIEMATGFPTGLYYQFGERLKKEVTTDGVNLEVKATGGTIDNLALLNDPKSGVKFAMIQGGVADVTKYPNLVSIAGMFYEPVWVWYREPAFKSESGKLSVLGQLKGKRVAIGNEGSGTLALSTALLKMSGIAENEIHTERLKPDEALAKLNSGDLDAAFIVAAAEAPVLEKFYKIPGIRLMSFDQADAYTRNMPYLSKVNVPRGLLSIEHDLPRQDIQVIAPTATLVTQDNVSPAMISLLLSASYDILKSYSRLQKPGEFPSSIGMDFPLHVDAEIYLKDGPSFLHRHLPFWTAVWVGRFVKIVIPLLVIFIPLFTYIPSAKNFLLRLKLAQVYTELRELDKNAFNPVLKEKNLKDLEAIERRVNNIKVSMMDSKELYDLKGHVGDVRARLKHLYP
ncbi:C4-dicarboxylate ABC transporter substrate-binding protein [Polynucleobacter wuianus]|uniref:C4-dicarboxylate ABC transporter substrate-binding protein n=1 Tax=Polynucleobacter wuianus TaxID=1743168 RepID=A0A191UGK3_9BURK|nr:MULTISPECIES: TAXI family TRAP transporter solute-binding subunit [Polynucleobacter]ANJ00052.1 C4-dicarboxylate ABC transporter substrate-binding protein [Polynucleobacter wuianus]MBU3552888.1 TAXI family TRAP transporter solute-binding subunit [Polynucleobacter sp. MWH-Post4-6-1]